MDIEKNFKTFIELLEEVERPGIDRLIEWLKSRDTKLAPASSRYHLNIEGGLIQHSLNVYYKLMELFINYLGKEEADKNKESIIISALLHDVSKINYYEKSSRNKKVYKPDGSKYDELGNFDWTTELSYKVKDEGKFVYASHPENSLFIISEFIKLTYDEKLAIRWHGGAWEGSDSDQLKSTIWESYRKSKLAFFLHLADEISTVFEEIY